MIDWQSAEDRDAAAGEYVLGTLNSEDQIAFLAALERDSSLQAEVAAWQDRLLGLSLHAAPAEPRAQVWQRIDIGLNAITAATSRTPLPEAASPRDAWWRRLAPWQALSACALAATLVLAVALGERLWQPPPAERYVAVLQSPNDRSTGWLVEIVAQRTLRLLPVGAETAPATGRSLQFWTKPQGAAVPTSLGLVSAGQRVELPVTLLPSVGEQQLFEVTSEPEGGSQIGRPTGPILYVGRTVHL